MFDVGADINGWVVLKEFSDSAERGKGGPEGQEERAIHKDAPDGQLIVAVIAKWGRRAGQKVMSA